MSSAGSRCRFSPVKVAVLATFLSVFALLAALLTALAPPVFASPAPLSVTVDHPLSLVDQVLTVAVEGQVDKSLIRDKLVLRVKGPAGLSQVGQSASGLQETGKVVVELGVASLPESSEATGPASSDAAAPSPVRFGAGIDFPAGVLEAEVSLPHSLLGEPGAYLVVAEIKSAGVLIASGEVWVGKAAARDTPLDLAFVWPVSLGIHRDADGRFFDQVLEGAVSAGVDTAGSDSGGDLRSLLALQGRFPDWSFTLALEPVLLTQLRDMADGYTRLDESGSEVAVGADDASALAAGEALAAFKGLSSSRMVEVVIGPYASADLGLLAAEGWRDGLQQILMGKQEVQQTLGLENPPKGAYSPGLGLTTDSLSYYAGASIDHVVVDEGLKDLLAEPVAAEAVAVRARNVGNDRVTLVFANSELSACMSPPSWDGGIFAALLAAELATGNKDAVVVTPDVEFTLVPGAYLESIGETLAGAEWIRTLTLTELLRAHNPGTRPILLQASPGSSGGYIQESLFAGLKTTHAIVSNLAAIADATRAPVEEARWLLYIAESSWWSRSGTSPQEASAGMRYAEKARLVAQAELDKVRLLEGGSTTIMGGEGIVSVIVENDTGYPLTVEMGLAADGVELSQEGLLEVELDPGRTKIPVRVARGKGPQRLDVVLLAGGSPLGEAGYQLRFITLVSILPWIVLAALVVVTGGFLLAYRAVRKRRALRAN